jgi:hypothetical protein
VGVIEEDEFERNGGGEGYGGRGDYWYRPSRGYGDSGRLGGTETATGAGEVKFKGRGSMKYRERKW